MNFALPIRAFKAFAPEVMVNAAKLLLCVAAFASAGAAGASEYPIDRMIAGRDPSVAMKIYDEFYSNASNLVFKPNPGCWAARLDLSCLSVWNTSAEPHSHGGTLISPWHVLFAKHWYLGPGTGLYFREPGGRVVMRKIAGVRHVGGTDLTVASLAGELRGVEPVRVLSAGSAGELTNGAPVLVVNQDKFATVADLSPFPAGKTASASAKFAFRKSAEPGRAAFFFRVRSMDSGSPTFLVDGRGPVLAGLHWEVGEDSNVAAYAGAIQRCMDELKPGCKLKMK
ncbi:MAG: hypothetical protein J6T01_01055 [Kiritimatiellae bacterium]|nr:hypothetical protein [Kiritimatiellia bacterium]